SLSLVALKCDLAKHLVARDPEQALHEIEDAEAVTRSALKEVRETVAGYRRPTLEAELAAARELLAAAGIGYHCEGPSTTLSGPTEAALAWAVREGVTNVIRHSRARRCEIRFSSEWDGVQLEVTDDGSGPNGNEAHHSASGSSGLVGLSERIARAGGHLETGPGPDGGFRLSVWLPLTSSGQADEAAGKATR